MYTIINYTNLKSYIIVAVIDDDNTSDNELAVQEEGIANDAASIPDDGRDIHDATILKTTYGQAIAKMREKGVEINLEEKRMALQPFPRVSYTFKLYTLN